MSIFRSGFYPMMILLALFMGNYEASAQRESRTYTPRNQEPTATEKVAESLSEALDDVSDDLDRYSRSSQTQRYNRFNRYDPYRSGSTRYRNYDTNRDRSDWDDDDRYNTDRFDAFDYRYDTDQSDTLRRNRPYRTYDRNYGGLTRQQDRNFGERERDWNRQRRLNERNRDWQKQIEDRERDRQNRIDEINRESEQSKRELDRERDELNRRLERARERERNESGYYDSANPRYRERWNRTNQRYPNPRFEEQDPISSRLNRTITP